MKFIFKPSFFRTPKTGTRLVSSWFNQAYHCRTCDSPRISERYEFDAVKREKVPINYSCLNCGRTQERLVDLTVNI